MFVALTCLLPGMPLVRIFKDALPSSMSVSLLDVLCILISEGLWWWVVVSLSDHAPTDHRPHCTHMWDETQPCTCVHQRWPLRPVCMYMYLYGFSCLLLANLHTVCVLNFIHQIWYHAACKFIPHVFNDTIIIAIPSYMTGRQLHEDHKRLTCAANLGDRLGQLYMPHMIHANPWAGMVCMLSIHRAL